MRKNKKLYGVLCEDVWCVIFLFCPIDTILKTEIVCRSFYKIINSEYFLNECIKIKVKNATNNEKKRILSVNNKVLFFHKSWGNEDVIGMNLYIYKNTDGDWSMDFLQEGFNPYIFTKINSDRNCESKPMSGIGLCNRRQIIKRKSLFEIILTLVGY